LIPTEIIFFLTLGAGYLLGSIKLGAQRLGSVLGVLIAGLIIEQLDVSVGANAKWIFFDLFLQFVQGLRSSGAVQVGLTLIFFVVAMSLVILSAWVLGLDAGSGVGMFAGSLTVSAALGVAGDALQRIAPSGDVAHELQAHMTSVFAACYVIGMLFTTWFLSRMGPKILGTDLAASCKALERELGVQEFDDLRMTMYHEFTIRSYRVDQAHAGMSVIEIERSFVEGRVFVEAIHRGSDILTPGPDDRIMEDDVIALSGREQVLAAASNPWRALESPDRVVLEIPSRTVTVIVTSKDAIGTPLSELAHDAELRSVFLAKIERAGHEIIPAATTVLQPGDKMTISGRSSAVERAAERLGMIEVPTRSTNIAMVAMTIVVGAMIGIPAIKFGDLELGLGVGVGILVGGLALGYYRSTRKHKQHLSESVLWVLDNVGLTGFVAVTALEAAPLLIPSLREVGFRVLAPGLAAIQDVANSKVPTMGYSVTYALGNILLALGGSILVSVLL
jgi:putative transport protein